jgi:hypothetical protein
MGDLINKWRKELDLDEIAMFEGPHLAEILKVPFTYCWSPALVPKPSDWPSYIGQSLQREFWHEMNINMISQTFVVSSSGTRQSMTRQLICKHSLRLAHHQFISGSVVLWWQILRVSLPLSSMQ